MLQRIITKGNLLLMSAGSMVGASWLFSPFIAAKMAGPFALFAWIIAALFMFIIALPLCELGTLFPLSGGMVNYPNMTHGHGFGFLFSWISWLSYVVCGPIEVQSVMQYASYFFPSLIDKSQAGFHLSFFGILCSIITLMLVTLINTLGLKLFIRCNRLISIFKFIVPTCTIIAFFIVAPSFTHHLDYRLPHAKEWAAIFSSLSLGGIAFAFTGFQNGLMLAGEVKNPASALPMSLLGAVLIGFLLYFSLQWGFIIALPDSLLAHGWENINFVDDSAPLVGLAMLLGLMGIATLLMIDASVSPLGTTLVYSAATARILYAMGLNKDLPAGVSYLNRYRVPAIALGINFFVGALSFAPFSGWQSMVAFLSSCSILSYLIGPICLLALRTHHVHLQGDFRLKFTKIVCFLGFYAGLLMILWCGFDIIWKLSIAILVGIILHIIADSEHFKEKAWICWFTLFFAFLLPLSYFGKFGGIGLLTLVEQFLLLVPISFILLIYAIKISLPHLISSLNAFQK